MSAEDRSDNADASSGASDAEREAALEDLVRLLVSGKIALRIENVEERDRALALHPLDPRAAASGGLGRRLVQAAYSWIWGCPVHLQYPPPRPPDVDRRA